MKDRKFIYKSLLLMTAWMIASCTNDSDSPITSEPVMEAVDFSGEMQKGRNDRTRAGEEEDVWLDMDYDAWRWDDTPIDFIIHQQVNEGNSLNNNTATYQLSPGEKGRLVCTEGSPLNWVSANAAHIFHSWTQPAGLTMSTGNETGTVDITHRNLDYEYFVGTKAGTMKYATQGVSVGLRFEHLVGKIVIDRITLIMADGSINSDIWTYVRSISFPNMPVSGTFTTGIGEGEDMKVIHDDRQNKGVTFRVADYSQYFTKGIPFYVLPQSFSDGNLHGKFFVTLNHGDGIRMYEGNLNELVNEIDPDKPLTGINAGECLTIRLVLKDNKVDGFYVHIQNWNTAEKESITDKPYPGIYSTEDIVNNTTDLGGGKYLLNLEDLVYEEKDGMKIVRLCNNIDLSAYPGITLVIPEDYVLDRCGYNITGNNLKIEGETLN